MEKYQVEAGKKEEILDEAIDASENPRLRGWLGWIEKTRSHQVSALQVRSSSAPSMHMKGPFTRM